MSLNIRSQLEALEKHSEEQWERHRKLLPESDDASLVVLKGHLIIEEMLFTIAEAHCANVDALYSARLSFAQLLCVVRALIKLPIGEQTWKAIGLLNTIRNALVHNLEPEEVDARMRSLMALCEPKEDHLPPNYEKPTTSAKMASASICFIVGQLSVIGVVATFIERNLKLTDVPAA